MLHGNVIDLLLAASKIFPSFGCHKLVKGKAKEKTLAGIKKVVESIDEDLAVWRYLLFKTAQPLAKDKYTHRWWRKKETTTSDRK